MTEKTGSRVRMLREQRGWTQEHLARVSGLSLRTLQRLESEGVVSQPENLQALAAAFDVDVSRLRFGFTAETLGDFESAFLCPTCGAALEAREFVQHEYGDCEYEVFGCGHSRGWQFRPCPKDPRFPSIEDYELHFHQETDGSWWCHALGKTTEARAVELGTGVGSSREAAEHMVRHFYVRAREGSEEAERLYPIGV